MRPSPDAVLATAYGPLRSTQDRDGQLIFLGEQLQVDGNTTSARVTVEIGPGGPRPLFTPAGDDLAGLPGRAVMLLWDALIASVRTWIDGPGTEPVVLASVRAQLRAEAVRNDRYRAGAKVLGLPEAESLPAGQRTRWAWLLAEYARLTRRDPAAVAREWEPPPTSSAAPAPGPRGHGQAE